MMTKMTLKSEKPGVLFLVFVLALTMSSAGAAIGGTSGGRTPSRGLASDRAKFALKKSSLKKTGRKKSKATTQVEKKPSLHDPRAFVDARVTRILRDLKGRAPRSQVLQGTAAVAEIDMPIAASRTQWLQAVYSRRLVDASEATGLLSDKLLFYELARRELGAKAEDFLVKSIGLREFLIRQNLVDEKGQLKAGGDDIEAALFRYFPAGFVARPAVGVAPRETGRGLFKNSDEFVAELLKPKTFLYQPDHRRRPVRSTVLGSIASGEAIVLQDDVLAPTLVEKKPMWREVRVHTYESRVLSDANANFWIRDSHLKDEEVLRAQSFVSDFLKALPQNILSRQAFSFDVLILPDGKLKIVDLLTNRGRKMAWSSYLDQPRVIGAYTRHFESYAGVKFAGLGGYLLRKNAGNYFGYWGLKIERSRPGFDKVLAWIPPWP